MEYINMSEAARRSGLSTKTLQRAIKAGELHEAPRLQDNQARIAVDELERWLTARQSTEGDEHLASMKTLDPETRLAELEQTIARMQEQAEIDQKLLSNRMDVLEKRMNEHYGLLLSIQEVLTREQQETEGLRHRLIELEAISDPLREKREAMLERMSPLVQREMERIQGASPAETIQDNTDYALADFTQVLQREYRSSATRGDVKAWFTLRPEPQGIEGDYRVDYFECGRADGKRGQMGKQQQARGEQLKADLRARAREAAFNAGWTKGPHDIFVCPK